MAVNVYPTLYGAPEQILLSYQQTNQQIFKKQQQYVSVVMVIVDRNGHDDLSSNPSRVCFYFLK